MAEPAGSIELIPIESQTRTIQTCFQQCLYEVPNFQRPYSWSSDQLEDYWHDVVLAQGDFFFGSTVTWVSKKRELFNDTYSIIDGQQRLTTSAIILSVIRDALLDLSKTTAGTHGVSSPAKSQADATQKYLIVADDDGEEHRVLHRPENMFYEHIQQPDAIPSGVKWNASAERIGEARKFFEKKIIDTLKDRSLDDRLERLKLIRSNVLKARVIQVELASEEDGFLIFETLNTRGADLLLSDLVKNMLVRSGAKNALDRDAIATRWERIVDSVQEGRINPDVDRFIWQSWNSRRVAVTEPELFKKISNSVASGATKTLSYLKELEVDASTYRWLETEHVRTELAKHDERNALAVPEFVDSVRALAIFKVSVANSAILATARKYQETKLLSRGQLIEVLRLLENFHFQFTALTSSSSTGGTRRRYNKFAVTLENANTKQEVADAIHDLKEKLRAGLPNRDPAISAFRGIFYAPKLPLSEAQKLRARKMFVAYVLMTFAKWHKILPAGQNLESWSIEHIKPQSQGTEYWQDSVYSIGNLTLLTKALNSELGDAKLPLKLAALRKGSAYFDPDLESWSADVVDFPSEAQIATRGLNLAQEALENVWSL
ncbi:DUF262 domain-containing protein [Actinoplanes derwentensis]|uniref:DUF262 domain-containing protein n=1 Tax=Actinoplanes derwentensis TaxID=113562 RepID=A0A1H2CJ93_9ACTN|nr:DUF262 domain-containing protein [Actinoplanes derwentensis]GID82550.1 hypothetical protein Ade03nite_14740 [Actinoplanes derwentensis]SDT70322.1 Protein of unknown function [Actinoplanes derwentensis]